jgi:hypothetical protein
MTEFNEGEINRMDIHSAAHIPSTSGPYAGKPAVKPAGRLKGRIQARHLKVATLVARGFPISFVAKEAGLSETRIYHLLADPDSFVNQEVHRILNDLFASNDRMLLNIYLKVLVKLDEDLSSDDPEVRGRAIDQVIKVYMTRTGKSGNPTIAQYINVSGQGTTDFPANIDELIIQKRKERGLPLTWEDE